MLSIRESSIAVCSELLTFGDKPVGSERSNIMSTFAQTPDDSAVMLENVKVRARTGRSHLMSETERKRFVTILESMEAGLAGRLGSHDGIAIEKSPDPLDEVQFAGERELAIRGLHRESNLLRRVRAALDRLAGGTYGPCLLCEEAISPKRLAAAPWSVHCLKCQEAADRRELEGVEAPDSFLVDAA